MNQNKSFTVGEFVDWQGAKGQIVKTDGPTPFSLSVRFKSGFHRFTAEGKVLLEQTEGVLKKISAQDFQAA